MATEPFEGWAILELMGHRRLAGYVKEQELAGVGFLRIEIPGGDGPPVATQFYAPAALYCLTPTTEDIARGFAAGNKPAPVTPWEIEAPKPRVYRDEIEEESEDLDDEPEEGYEEANPPEIPL